MIKIPYIKLGTKPFGPGIIKSKRNIDLISEGSIIEIKEDRNDKIGRNIFANPWKKVRVDKIKKDVWFVSVI